LLHALHSYFCVVGRQVRDGWAYGCAMPRAYDNRNPGLA